MSFGRTVILVLTQETCGGIMAAQTNYVWRSNDNVGNLAFEVVGQNWSSEVISLFEEDWEVGRVAIKPPRVNGPFMPRNEGCV